MANTRSGGANNEGAGGTSARKGSAATNAKDPMSATTSTSSASGRESRSLSTRETSDEQKPNLRRSKRETKGKNPILTTSSASTPVSQKSIRGRSNPSTPGTPKTSARKLKGSTRKASTPRTSDRVKKSTVSASTDSNDSNGVSSPVATPDKTVKGEIDEHNSTKNDASESGTMPLKKQKRLTAQSYTNPFKTSSEEYEKSPAYEGNASKVHAEDNGCVLRYEESGAHEEDNQAHLSQVANKFLEGYTSGLCEVPKVILETDGLKSDVEKSEEDKQAYLSQRVDKFWEGYTSGQCEAPEVILETDGLKTDVEKSAPISEDLVTLSSPVQAHMTADLCSSNPAMDATDPTDDCSELALNVAMGQKADSSKFVEYWVPARLSRVQLEVYCYTLLSNSPALRSHSKTDSVGALRNILVSLRKCCDHPYLVDKTLHLLLTKGHPVTDILDIGVSASGKLLLLDKMLQEIWKKGQRVLILSQSCGEAGNPMGDILDDFVHQRFGFESYERVERDLNVRKKQGAMSMFNDTTKGRFIFLIDSRACVPSIKLLSVDVIIIYCSDWNPTNDLRVLQKISIESQSECVPIFRLYSSCTVEEKALILAKHDHILDSTVQNIRPILSHSLLSWGASFLFSRLEGLKNYACLHKDSDAEKLFMDKVLLDLKKLSTKDDPSTKMSNAAISQAHLSGPFYSRDSLVVGEREGISAPDSDLPKFWVDLLDQKSPRWQYITEQAQRSRRKIQNMEDGKIPADEADEASTKRRKIAGILDSSANVLAGEDKDSILPGTNTASSSHQTSVDDTWQEQGVENLQDTQKSLHIQLKPELSKLYELFELPGSVKCLCEELLEYTLKNHQVSQVPKDILHAFNIALCWRAASLSRHKVDHRESLALAVEHLKYECSETLAEKVYKKLRILKKEFSHRVGRISKSNQSISVKNISPYQQETSTKYGSDKSIPKQAASVGGNESHQEDSHDLVIEPIVPGEKEVLYVPEIHEKQHLSKDALLNRITEKRIKLVDMVFSLREKNIHDKQTNEVAMFDMHRHKGVDKLREACRIVVEHLRRSQADPEDRGGQTKLIVEWFTMLLYAFLKHMRYQREKLDLQQSMVWTKELQLKENFLHEAKFGQLDLTFDEHIYLPDSGFAIEEFSHFSSCVDTATLANCQQSLHETSAMEVTLVRSVIPSDVINAEAARNGSAEVLIHNEGMPASDGIGLTENRTSNSFDCIDSQGGASLSVQHQVNSSPAIDNSINQESSSGDRRRTQHVEQQSGVASQPLPGETDQHLGDAEMEVNTSNGDNTQADPPCLEPETLAPVPSQASLQMSKEVEAEANLVLQSAQPIAAPAQLLQREAEQVDRSGMIPAQTLQPEMEPSASREAYTQADLIIQSAQPSMVPTELSQRNVEQASLYHVPSSQCLPSGMHPWVPLSSILLERTHSDQCQPSHQPEAALGSSAKMVASMVFNHPPVGDEPLKNELHRLRSYIDSLNKTNELKKSQLRTECSQEIDKVKQKYDLLLQEQDSTHLQQTKTIDNLCEKVLLNQSIADYFRAKFISSSGAQARAHSPPNHQTPQASQQVSPWPSAVASTASPAASSSAGRPPVLTHHIQPLQVDRPSPTSSPSSQVVRPRPSILNNIVRSPSTTFSLAPVLPRGSFGVQSELARARAPAPHLRRRLPPQVHSMASANQQQLPTKLESMSAWTRATPVTPVNIRQSCPQAVPPGNPSLSSLHPSLYPTLAALLGPSSSHQIQQVPLLPSSSQPTRLSSPVPSTPNPVLPLTSPRGLTMTSSVTSAASNVLPSRGVGPSASGTTQSDSDSARWMNG
uniref:Helicase C-terminal domain-containing protein n=1 Tax=Aegilops tauschii subsp. strangulata TaxID=200361 RepID=A0A453LN82_AEGTS